jgi:hypothetical protein
MRNIVAVGLSTMVVACSALPAEIPEPRRAWAVNSECPPRSSEVYFFPDVAAAGHTNASPLSDRMRRAFGEILTMADSDSLSCGSGPTESYRFAWLPANRSAMVLTASRDAAGWRIRSTVFEDPRVSGQFGAPPKVTSQSDRRVEGDALPLVKTLESSQFWTVAASDRTTADDGAAWLLEGRKSNSYRLVVQVNSEDTSVVSVGQTLIELAGLDPPAELLRLLKSRP